MVSPFAIHIATKHSILGLKHYHSILAACNTLQILLSITLGVRVPIHLSPLLVLGLRWQPLCDHIEFTGLQDLTGGVQASRAKVRNLFFKAKHAISDFFKAFDSLFLEFIYFGFGVNNFGLIFKKFGDAVGKLIAIFLPQIDSGVASFESFDLAFFTEVVHNILDKSSQLLVIRDLTNALIENLLRREELSIDFIIARRIGLLELLLEVLVIVLEVEELLV
mmetsp:Transcript_31221/g.28394  ORF Transcript_31221/g.28394 Transcript_31221/m.28394 type:complete len:221 (-) Transcript_31221:446-1108(-)